MRTYIWNNGHVPSSASNVTASPLAPQNSLQRHFKEKKKQRDAAVSVFPISSAKNIA